MSDISLTDSEFEEKVLKSKLPVIVDFWAPWCGPCKLVSPIIEQLAGEVAEKVTVYKMDVDQNPKVSEAFGIMSIPTVMFFKEGKPVGAVVGARSKEDYKRQIQSLLG